MTQLISAARNRLRYITAYLREKAQGLDFTMPDRMYDRRRNDGAMYYASPSAVLGEVFSAIDKTRYARFLDVGCGKGYVLKTAAEYGFHPVGGIEYDPRLAAICERNMRHTGLDGRVSIACCDAASYENYGDYNCFYFYNPFMAAVMERVIGAICRQCRGKAVTLVYYRPRYTEPIERTGYFRRVRTLHDPIRDYDIYIYEGVIAPAENDGAREPRLQASGRNAILEPQFPRNEVHRS